MERELRRIEPHADLHHIDVADGRLRPVLPVLPRPRRRHRAADAAADPRAPDGRGARSSRRRPASSSTAGADLVSVHAENGAAGLRAAALAQSLGAARRGGAAARDAGRGDRAFLEHVAFVTLLGTAIGVKGQGLDATACDRLAEARALLRQAGRTTTSCSRPTAASATRPCRGCGRPAPRPWCSARSPSATPDLAGRIRWLHALDAAPR